MKKKLVLLLVFAALTGPMIYPQQKITVAAAANVQYAMNELKAEFTKKTGITVDVVIGSSGQLTAQINEGAPYDIFISADMKYPQSLYASKNAVDTPRVYARGSLVLWTLTKGIKPDSTLAVLLSARVKKIALANPRTAPYGVAAVEAMKKGGIYDKVAGKLVYGESIAPTNHFIFTKTAEIGFTAKSVVLSPKMKNKGEWIELSSGSYKPIEQGCVILKYGFKNHREDAIKFYNFLFSQKAKDILKKYGYITG